MTLTQVGRYFRDKAVPFWRKGLLLAGVAYTVMPLDAVPDVLPLVGWLDDLGVLAALATFLVRDIQRHTLAAQAVQVVDAAPVRRLR